MKYVIKNKQNRQLPIQTVDNPTPDNKYNLAPHGISYLTLTDTEYNYLNSKYSDMIIIRPYN